MPLLIPIFVLDPDPDSLFSLLLLLSSNFTCFVSGFVIFRCFCCRRSIYFLVAVNNDVIVCIVVLVITVVAATSLAVVHINVKLQPLLQLFFLVT